MQDSAEEQRNKADIGNKRRLVFGSLMLYAPETGALRDRAIEHTVLAALVGSSPDARLKNGEIQTHLRLGNCGTILRSDVVFTTLKKLEQKGLVDERPDGRGKVGYFLTQAGEDEANREVSVVSKLLSPVLGEMLQHTEQFVSTEIANRFCTDFICSIFTRLGSSIAAYVGGQQSQVGNVHQVRAIAEEIADHYELSREVKESLIARCLALLKSESTAAKRLIFHLTQGYYFAQLLGMDSKGFTPIAEQAFAGAVFYCDTNVLFAGLFPGDNGLAFSEIVNLAAKCGIRMCMTRATVEEARYVASERLASLKKIDGPIPSEIADLSSDEFVTHFFELKRQRPDLTPDDFMEDFLNLADVAQTRWGITLEEVNENEMLGKLDTSQLEIALQDAITAARGWPKPKPVLKHDIAHYVFIESVRKTTPKAWFLTRDQSLIASAPALARQEKPPGETFCFSMLGFLQSISPFITTTNEENVVSRFFSSLLKDQIFLSEKLFDAKELALMAEMHSDVMATPADVLVPAVDFIKHTILRGKAYGASDTPLVALELRKFLSSSKDEKQAVLHQRTLELEALNEAARENLRKEHQATARVEAELHQIKDALEAEKANSAIAKAKLNSFERADTRRIARNERVKELIPIIGLCTAAIISAHYAPSTEQFAASRFGASLSINQIRNIIRAAESVLFVAPLLFVIMRSSFSSGKKTVLSTLAIVGWIFILGLYSSPKVGMLADVAGVAALVALSVSFLEKKEDAAEARVAQV